MRDVRTFNFLNRSGLHKSFNLLMLTVYTVELSLRMAPVGSWKDLFHFGWAFWYSEYSTVEVGPLSFTLVRYWRN